MPLDVGAYAERPTTTSPGSSAGRYCQPGRTTLAPITCASGSGPSLPSSANSVTDRPLVNNEPSVPSAPRRSSARGGIPPASIRASACACSPSSSLPFEKNPITRSARKRDALRLTLHVTRKTRAVRPAADRHQFGWVTVALPHLEVHEPRRIVDQVRALAKRRHELPRSDRFHPRSGHRHVHLG